MSVLIRETTSLDLDRVLQVEREAFGGLEEAEIVRTVQDLEGSFGLVAEEDATVVGHVQLSRAWIGSDPVLSLGPIGVLPARQRRGIGSALVRAALDAARGGGEVAVILLGSPAFYPRFGFFPGSGFGLDNPFTGTPRGDGLFVAEEDFMVAPLDSRAFSLAGSVRWHAAFGEPVEGRDGPR